MSRAQVVVVAVAVVLGVMVAGYGVAGSYVTVSSLAARRGVPLPGLVPAGIDGGVLAVVVLDLVVAWVGMPIAWLRQVVRLLALGTIAANVIGGWPDPVAVSLHAAALVMLLIMIEAGRVVLLRRIGQVEGRLREAIPLARWVLAPWRTCLVWRRMVLWQITSYRHAIDTELETRRAVALLRVSYGRRWRRHAPTDLVWMLRTGVDVAEACARIDALIGHVDADSVGRLLVSSQADGDAVERQGVKVEDTVSVPGAVPISVAGGAISGAADAAAFGELGRVVLPTACGDRRFAEAVRLNREHWMETGRPISAETLRKRLRLGAGISRNWCRMIRDADRAAVCRLG